ncbi:hypothetical protein AB0K60_08325 [Thermopolyspora sp. NPDC052614]|uniref:hypothetical protein n=1 Tax=Thermopolyspora sp. NPDC052614 TaxID=3155682 RepID=UPI0034287EC0
MVLLLTGCTSSKAPRYEDDRAFADFVLAALSVAYPDYIFGPGTDVERTDSGLTVRVTASEVGSAFGSKVGHVPVSVVLDEETGQVRVPELPATRLGRVVGHLGGATDPESAAATRELLSNMGHSVVVVAVAELAEPVTEAMIDKARLGSPQKVLLSSGWISDPLASTLFCGKRCNEMSSVSSFQDWVETLRPEDKPALEAFDLELKALQAAARQGRGGSSA